MDNKTRVFDPQQEITRLKQLIETLERRVSDLEMGGNKYFPTYQPPSVPGYPPQPPIFGPGNNEGVPLPYITPKGLMGDWLKVFSVDDNKEIK